MEKNLNKGDEERKDEINVNHLDVGCWRETIAHLGNNIRSSLNDYQVTYINKECCENQHRGEVNCDNGFKEESLEVIG